MNDASASGRETPEPGLRIEPKSLYTDSNSNPGTERKRIEVQELNRSVIRLEHAEPTPPRVESLLTFHPKPDFSSQRTDSSGERGEWGRSKQRHPMFWMLGAGAGVAAAVILTLISLPLINASNAVKSDPRRRTYAVENEAAPADAQRINQMLTRKSEALRLFKSFAQATHSDDIKPIIRNGMAMEDVLRKHWHPLIAATQWTPPADLLWDAFDQDGRIFLTLSGSFPDHSKFHAYFTPEGDHLALDWKASTAFGTACFSDLESQNGDPSEIRGHISTSDFYSATWPEEEYSSYRLASPDGENSIWCYARRDTPAFASLANLLNKSEIIQDAAGEKKITLSLKSAPDGARPNQWLIHEVLGIDWGTP